jgi:hypothetical protein
MTTRMASLLFLSSAFYSSCTVIDESLAAGACLDQGDCDAIQGQALLQVGSLKPFPRPDVNDPSKATGDATIGEAELWYKATSGATTKGVGDPLGILAATKPATTNVIGEGRRRRKVVSLPKDVGEKEGRPTVDDIAEVIRDATFKDVVQAVASLLPKSESPTINQDISGQISGPLKEGLEPINEKVSSVAESVDDLMSMKEDMENVATKEDVSGAEEDLKKEVRSSRDKTKKGIIKVGKVVTQNSKTLEALYDDLHGSR